VRRFARVAGVAGACAATAIGAAAQGGGNGPAGAPRSFARVTITPHADGAVEVRQRYVMPDDTGRLTFRVLSRPCAIVTGAAIVAGDRGAALVAAPQGPWTQLDDTSTARLRTDSLGFELRYLVTLTALDADVPIVHLVRPISRETGGAKPVTVIVNTLSVPDASVTFPSFRRQGKAAWVGEFVALPSFVHVAMPDSRVMRCMRPLEPNSDGGLSWRVVLFVGIMVAWVPLYLLWARGGGGGDTA
jgi:hypothetical protein